MRSYRMVFIAASALATSLSTGRLAAQESLPAFMVGNFVDDYGIQYVIDDHDWNQGPRTRLRVHFVSVSDRYIVAQNDAENVGDPNLWTRIDWVELDDAGEYQWAYCYAAYRAESADAAVAAPATRRDTPRTGCSGFPFSRMKPEDP